MMGAESSRNHRGGAMKRESRRGNLGGIVERNRGGGVLGEKSWKSIME